MKKALTGLLLIYLLSLLVSGCAPKQVKVYETLPDKRGEMVQYALTLMGKPYKAAAKGPDAFDCSGFVYYVHMRFDVPVPYTVEELSRVGYEVGRGEVMVGDLVFFRIKRAAHIGIMINQREFVHASTSRGVTIGDLDTPYWKKSFSHFRRVM